MVQLVNLQAPDSEVVGVNLSEVTRSGMFSCHILLQLQPTAAAAAAAAVEGKDFFFFGGGEFQKVDLEKKSLREKRKGTAELLSSWRKK